ncbi:MAG TPA: hypothetical protein VN033_08400 [Vulgatibacter sp.]|nr:hypothetical protein [Vulgatibacter sp.]
MSLWDYLLRRTSSGSPRVPPLLSRIEARLPPDGGPGLLPAEDPEAAAEERRLGERFAAELHLIGRREDRFLATARRLAAIASAARRRDPEELHEAVEGVAPWELPDLLEALSRRGDVSHPLLAETGRRLAARASDPATLAAAIACVSLDLREEDVPLVITAGRSPALAGVCAQALERLPKGRVEGALLDLAEATTGLSRSMALERLALRHLEDPAGFRDLALRALELAASVEDPLERAWAAVPLLEAARADERLLEVSPALAGPAVACLEAVSRGGWNGGPGPGLARLPVASRTALAVLESAALPKTLRRRAAAAVLDARPMPTGPVRVAAERLAGGQT